MAEHQANDAHGSTVGLNEFSDWTHAEYKRLLGFKGSDKQSDAEPLDTSNLADSVDWRTKGAVTAVKN